jgi:hypothetical protein
MKDEKVKTTWYIGGGLGATMFELQIRRLYVRFCRPRYINRRSWPWLRVTWLTREGNMPERKKNESGNNQKFALLS